LEEIGHLVTLDARRTLLILMATTTRPSTSSPQRGSKSWMRG
jgi:hypothetical protein